MMMTPHKAWTPRKTLIVHAQHHMKENNLRPHIAVDEVVQDWEQKKIHASAISYYINLSPAGMSRLINAVRKGK